MWPPLLRGRGKVGKGEENGVKGLGFPLVPAAWTGGQSRRLPFTAPNHTRSQGSSTHLKKSARKLQQARERARATVQTSLGQAWDGRPSWARKQTWAMKGGSDLLHTPNGSWVKLPQSWTVGKRDKSPSF